MTTRYRDVEIRAPRGTTLNAKSWLTEAPLRMLMNNLDPEVAENPKELVVYGGIGRAARNWECFDKIVEVLRRLEDNQTLLVQSGKPVGVFKTSFCQFKKQPLINDQYYWLGVFLQDS